VRALSASAAEATIYFSKNLDIKLKWSWVGFVFTNSLFKFISHAS